MGTFGLIDCDTHCYETRDAFTRYLPTAFMDRTVFPIRLANGQETVLAGDRVAVFSIEPGLGFDKVWRPGSLKETLRQMANGNPDETYEPESMQAEYLEKEPRLALMDQQGVERCVLYPGLMGLQIEKYLKDQAALYANIHSYNRWLEETWGFGREGRIFAPALLSLRDLDSAVREVDQLLTRDVRMVLIPTGPVYGRSPGDPYFDPVWSRLNEARVVVTFHIMDNWYSDHVNPAWGLDPNPMGFRQSAWQWCNNYGERAVQETVSALIFDNVFARFPNLQVLASEFGIEWLPHFLKMMDKCRGMGRNGPWIGGPLKERPSAIFRRHVRVTPYPEDDVVKVVDQLGFEDCIVMGSDFPHAEGVGEPADLQKLWEPLSARAQQNLLRDNALSLFTTV